METDKNGKVGPVELRVSGKGLPYAPENWPNHGDIWAWKVGNKVNSSGYHTHRLLIVPKRLQRSPTRKILLASKNTVTHFLQTEFPEADIDAFFASFTWDIPAEKSIKRKAADLGSESFRRTRKSAKSCTRHTTEDTKTSTEGILLEEFSFDHISSNSNDDKNNQEFNPHLATYPVKIPAEEDPCRNFRTKFYAFFASFSWEIPSKLCEEGQNLFQEHPPSDNDLRCEAGNRFCSRLGAGEKFAMFCDICCNEPGFCRDCCCILCCKTISEAFGGYDYIRCEANIEGYICGHNCHIDCALRAYMIGTVGGRIGLDAEYYCRRCDSRTDLVSHVKKLVKNCESIDSRGDIEMVLKVCIRVLRGSKKTNANHLLHQIELAMEKLKKKAEAGDIWKKEDTSAVTSEFKVRVEKGNVVIPPIGSGTAPEEVDAVIEDMNAFYGCREASEEASIENFEANLRANVVHMYQLGQVATRAFRDFQHLKSQLVSTDKLRLEVHEAQKALRVSEASQEALSAELARVKDQLTETELRRQALEEADRESKGKIVVLEKALELALKEKAELKAAIPEGQKNFLRSWFVSPTYRATIFSESIRRALIFYDRALIHIQGRGWMSPEFDRSRVGLKFDYNLKRIPDPSQTDWAEMTEGDSFSWVWSEGCYKP